MAVALDTRVPDPLERRAPRWWLLLLTGVAWVVVALVILQFDEASTRTVGTVLGILFVVAGAQSLIVGYLGTGETRWINWIFGTVFIACGVVSLVQPEETFAGVADILGFIFLAIGVFWVVEALSRRRANELWWWGLVAGIAMVVLAFWTAGQFFIHKQYVLLVFAGIWALLHGVGDLIEAFRLRNRGASPAT